jgi:hypothetical protein
MKTLTKMTGDESGSLINVTVTIVTVCHWSTDSRSRVPTGPDWHRVSCHCSVLSSQSDTNTAQRVQRVRLSEGTTVGTHEKANCFPVLIEHFECLGTKLVVRNWRCDLCTPVTGSQLQLKPLNPTAITAAHLSI